MNTVQLVSASLILASSAALAQKVRYSATLVQPLAGSKEFVAGDNLWYCSGSTCTLVSQPKDADSAGACRALQRKVGALSAYGLSDRPFDAGKLAKCNGTS